MNRLRRWLILLWGAIRNSVAIDDHKHEWMVLIETRTRAVRRRHSRPAVPTHTRICYLCGASQSSFDNMETWE